ncbi:hypothetical protein [Halobacillus sp. A5]|uniref:hypothetical protein n=1 Tax=Halobacillus sp. A5 TaxID=2880263 RepID=UPI0020A697B2|nr:hypothetical protein [Halobacillus sp. A5]MCP3026591.1 hypothetical protein [Halobacillus sp. A5]
MKKINSLVTGALLTSVFLSPTFVSASEGANIQHGEKVKEGKGYEVYEIENQEEYEQQVTEDNSGFSTLSTETVRMGNNEFENGYNSDSYTVGGETFYMSNSTSVDAGNSSADVRGNLSFSGGPADEVVLQPEIDFDFTTANWSVGTGGASWSGYGTSTATVNYDEVTVDSSESNRDYVWNTVSASSSDGELDGVTSRGKATITNGGTSYGDSTNVDFDIW